MHGSLSRFEGGWTHWRKQRCVESEGALAFTDRGGSRRLAAWQQLEETLLYGFFGLAGGRITCNRQPQHRG